MGPPKGPAFMKTLEAIVLCAGRGTRLLPLTADRPKCLLPVRGKTILEHILDNLKEAGISPVHLVTGFKRGQIEALVREGNYSDVDFVFNPDFADTNTAWSLNLALKAVDADVVLLNGDVFFDPEILRELLHNPHSNCVVVDGDIALDSEEVKVIADPGGARVLRIGKDLDPGACLGEAIGINRISRDYSRLLIPEFNALERKGERRHFFEAGIDRLVRAGREFSIHRTRRPWVEIDTHEDYRNAREQIYARIHS
jgi:choline kinase